MGSKSDGACTLDFLPKYSTRPRDSVHYSGKKPCAHALSTRRMFVIVAASRAVQKSQFLSKGQRS